MIVIVALEELLNARPLKFRFVLLHLLSVGILPLTVRVLRIEVILRRLWDEGSLQALLRERLPVKANEPVMLLEDVWTFLTQPVSWLALDQLIDKICCLD